MRSACAAIALQGLEGSAVEVESQVSGGLVGTTLVGMGDTALRESRERLRAALHSCGVPALNRHLTINLSPAALPKTGSGFDLAIAVSTLMCRQIIDPDVAADTAFVGELGLDGSLRATTGLMAMAWAAQRLGFRRVVVPQADSDLARALPDIEVISCGHLTQLMLAFPVGRPGQGWSSFAQAELAADTARMTRTGPGSENCVQTVGRSADDAAGPSSLDLSEVRGQKDAVEALLVAAAGGHNLLLHGEPGSGKTMLAERVGTILPPLSAEDALTQAALRGAIEEKQQLRIPSAAPVEILGPTATVGALLGGGGSTLRPGAISLAHGGVLVLDEAPEFAPKVLESLRRPLEAGEVTIRRSRQCATYPARFQLILTANPCPCGRAESVDGCQCTPNQKRRYRSRLSGPLLDRVDIVQRVNRPRSASVAGPGEYTSADGAELVAAARERSAHRWRRSAWSTNATAQGRALRRDGRVPGPVAALLEAQIEQGKLSLRGADKILRLAWSVADLAGRDGPSSDDFSRAVSLRTGATW